jgi:HSP20 family molecular chaperone IbpA
MPEKSATAVQTAPSLPPVKAARIEATSLERMEHLNDAISRRAFELFEQEGRVDGHHQRHWLEAERELLHPVHMRLEETDLEIMVHAELPGFTASDIEVSVEPRRVIITGKRESQVEDKQGDAVYTEQCSDEIFRTLDLPAEVNVMKVTATLKDGVLNVQLPKVTATTPAIAEPHAT